MANENVTNETAINKAMANPSETKTPLIYQATKYDCGPTTVVNALRFLYSREELDPELLTETYARTLDDFNEEGELGKYGTSHQAIRNVIRYFHAYGLGSGFPIDARAVRGEDVVMRPGAAAYDAIAHGAAGIARVWHAGHGHYILLSGVSEDGRLLAFDPSAAADTIDDTARTEITDMPTIANRSIDPAVLNAAEADDYALKNSKNADPTDPEIGEIGLIWRTA
ncbi:MAG: hypothetical protein LKJ47_07265 [Bifidobacteriaceae bacterium]|jgi:hypothetical protein|nr:hypothetical protein [Bifidobacteriaceae bacterium]